ncbi:hypothetical protein [Burkholderia sp. LMG 32019]|uniref:hypothetical protein n=1 Tax=Burkholderia sp. LMG 32019 TaxID=3158173 RepID=UPI003C2CF2CB
MRLQGDQEHFGSTAQTGGMAVYPFLRHFDLTFHKSGVHLLNRFLESNAGARHWLLLSDYAFHDKSKPADVATFTFVPMKESFGDLASRINTVAPSDIKHMSNVRPEFIELIKSYPTFSVSVVLGRLRRISKKEREGLEADLVMLKRMVDGWPPRSNSDYYRNLSRDFETLRKEVGGPGANMRVVRDLIIVSNLVAYLAVEFRMQLRDATLLWATDRDSMHGFLTKKCSGSLFHNFAFTLFHLLCERQGLDTEKSYLHLTSPEETGPIWYDAPLRIPDLICGALADMRGGGGEPLAHSHQKFRPVFDTLLVHEYSQLIFKIDFDKTTREPRASRLVFNRTPGQTNKLHEFASTSV